jgi:salicylate synthetase
VLKNVAAIAIGAGLGMGFNALGLVFSRGVAEIRALGTALGANAGVFDGPAGTADLFLTASSPRSLNRQLGVELGRGRRLDEVVAELPEVPEGIGAVRACRLLARGLGLGAPGLRDHRTDPGRGGAAPRAGARSHRSTTRRECMTGRTIRFRGTYDASATYRRLRDAGVLGSHSYLHLSPGRAEIGWAPVDHLKVTDTDFQPGWRERLGAMTASGENRKALGYVAFDMVDAAPDAVPDGSPNPAPLAEFIVPGEVVEFTDGGNVTHHTTSGFDLAPFLTVPLPWRLSPRRTLELHPVAGSPPEAFTTGVRRAVESLHAGLVQKVVLSRYQVFDLRYDPITLFDAITESRTFADAFLLSFGDLAAMVASPELLLASEDRALVSNPLAGTRPRGATFEEDERLRHELRHDHKEIVEHVLSVTTLLGQLEPVCEHDTLIVRDLMDVSIHQYVQHLSSYIIGRVSTEKHVLDALWAMFPSVTIAGFPREPAVRLLRSLEPGRRSLYSGVIGWVAGDADCRFSLAIRGVFRYGGLTYLHTGAGIMAESVPEREFMETEEKLGAARQALARAASLQADRDARGPSAV